MLHRFTETQQVEQIYGKECDSQIIVTNEIALEALIHDFSESDSVCIQKCHLHTTNNGINDQHDTLDFNLQYTEISDEDVKLRMCKPK